MYTHMSCCHPMKAFWTGSYTESGKLDLVICPSTAGDLLHVGFAQSKGHHIGLRAPLVRIGSNDYLTDPISIPCGNCVGCRMARAKAWKVRNVHESMLYKPDELHFVTLTYDDRHLPINDDGEPVLVPADLSRFIKALREPEFGVKRRYRFFGCGEYGGLFHRPHLHILLYGKLDDCIPYEFGSYHSATIDKAWNKGITQVKRMEPNLIAYCCGYVEKKQCDPLWDYYPVKPFLRMSTRPGIGSWYADRLNGSADRKVYGNFGALHYAGIPRAYLKLRESADWFKAFKDSSIELAKKSLITRLGAVCSSDEDVLGDILEDHLLESLEDKRRLQL